MPLTDTTIRNAKPGEKPVRMFDSGGLYLEVSPTGGKWWRLKYRFASKQKRLSLGVYPEVSLNDARDRRDASRKLLADGIDPSENRKVMKSARADRAANTFELVAREWFAKYSTTWAANHRDRIVRRFERDIFPWIGGRPIAAILASGGFKVRAAGTGFSRLSHDAVIAIHEARPQGQKLRVVFPGARTNVRQREQIGKHVLIVSLTAHDPKAVIAAVLVICAKKLRIRDARD
jgi:hypothetical protein